MISRSLRVPRNLFNTKGSFFHGKFFILKMAKNPINQKTLISAQISKKVTKSAVIRNRVRRRVYSIINPVVSKLPKQSLLFFQAKKGSETASFDEIKNDIEKFIISVTPL